MDIRLSNAFFLFYSSTFQPPANETSAPVSNNSQDPPPSSNFGGIPPLNLSSNGNGNGPTQTTPAPRYDSYHDSYYKNSYA